MNIVLSALNLELTSSLLNRSFVASKIISCYLFQLHEQNRSNKSNFMVYEQPDMRGL